MCALSAERRAQDAAVLHERRACAELVLATITPLDADGLSKVTPAVLRAATDLAHPPPLAILLDLAHLLLVEGTRIDRARALLSSELPTDDPALRRAVASVFDVLLSPLAVHPKTSEIREALARHPFTTAAEGAGALVAEIALRASSPSDRIREPLPIAAIRRALGRPAHEVVTKGREALGDTSIARDIAAGYDAAMRGARSAPMLVGPSDVIVAEGASHLRNRAARLALRQIADAKSALAQMVPTTIARRRSSAGAFATRQDEESTYPMGGFSSVSNSGSLENVVTSELAFASNGDIAEDLFAVRWAIGELLYYTRDEAVARRRRVSIWIVLTGELIAARIKDEDSQWQRLVLALGAVVVFIERAMHLLRNEALSIHVATPATGELGEEQALLRVLLSDAIAANTVEIIDADDAEIDARIEAARVHGEGLKIHVSVHETPTPSGARVVNLFVAREPVIASADAQRQTSGSSIQRWAETAKSLLTYLP